MNALSIAAVAGSIFASAGVTIVALTGNLHAPRAVHDAMNPRTQLQVVCPGGLWLSSITRQPPVEQDGVWLIRWEGREGRFSVPPACRGREGVLLESATPSIAEAVSWRPDREFPAPPRAAEKPAKSR